MRKKHWKKKSRVLGVPYSTARSTLMNLVLFDVLDRHGENICFRCGAKIETAKDLSMDHVEDWLNGTDPLGLFLDLKNVKFSHRSCNSAMRGTGVRTCDGSVSNKTGYKGVSRTTGRTKPFRAIIGSKQTGIRHLGYFETAVMAANAYDGEAIKLFGDRAVTNKSLKLIG